MDLWVTTWLRDDVRLPLASPSDLYESRSRTTLRAWGEAVIALYAERSQKRLTPSLEIRPQSVFAWPSGGAPETLDSQGRLARLRVAPAGCAVARKPAIDPVFAWESWRQLLEYLVEGGRSAGFIEEAISPVNPGEAVIEASLEGVSSYIRSLDQSLLDEIVSYFSHAIDVYLRSWTSLADWAEADVRPGEWEVLVPVEGLLQVAA